MSFSYIFPVLIILFIALFFIACPSPAAARLCGKGSGHLTRRDAAAMLAITAVYAACAFTGLGDTQGAESFHRFESGESVTVDLGSRRSIDGVMIYSGLNTGSVGIELSEDGAVWSDAGSFDQNYVALFKWNELELFDEAELSARYIRLTAAGKVWLGEIAVRSDGENIGRCDAAPELFDEQNVIPEYSHYTNSSYFDEIYHARTAYENLQGVYPYEVSHPPLGKLIIAIGIELFGMTPFGWRFSGALFGVLMLPIMYIFAKQIFRSGAVAACATAIFASDFMHFAQTRLATIDTYAVFFILLMYLFMYLFISEGKKRHLALSGIFFGIGAACKWTCLYAGAGLAIIWLIYWLRRFELRAFLKNCAFCIVFFVIVPAVVYYVSYYPYGPASGMQGPGMLLSRDYAQIVIDNQKFMFSYHSAVSAEHPYSSRWWQWLINERPILYYLKYFDDGTRSSFGAFLNPVLCWGGLAALIICAVYAAKRRDKASAFIVIGYLAQLLPWVFITRTTFEYHYFPASVFLVLAICRVLALIRCNVNGWRFNLYGLCLLSCALFVIFYPALTGVRVSSALASGLLKWLPGWPF